MMNMTKKTMTKKTGHWFRDNLWSIVVVFLLGLIAFGGKSFMNNQVKIQDRQYELNMEMIKAITTHEGQNKTMSEKITTINECNITQGFDILSNKEKNIEQDVNIEYLKKYKR